MIGPRLIVVHPTAGMQEVGIEPGDLFELIDVVRDEDICPVHGRSNFILLDVRLLLGTYHTISTEYQWQAQPWRFVMDGSGSVIISPDAVVIH